MPAPIWTISSRRMGRDNVYMEIQVNGIPEQDKVNEGVVRLAREVGRPLVGTGDVHYLTRDDYHHHAALLCVQTKSTLEQPKLRFDTNEFFLKSPEEMAKDFEPWPEAVPTTLEIAERCHTEIELDKLLLPRFPTPEGEEPGADAPPARVRGASPPLRGPARRPRRSSGWSTSSASSPTWASSRTS